MPKSATLTPSALRSRGNRTSLPSLTSPASAAAAAAAAAALAGEVKDGKLVRLPRDLSALGVKVADFGMSREAALSHHFKSANVYNPTWTAPEVILRQSYTAKVDVYR